MEVSKGQIKPYADLRAVYSPKKRTNFSYVFTVKYKEQHFYFWSYFILFISPNQTLSSKMDILREAIKIINEKFPLDSEFEIYERETLCSITKKKWEKAYIRENADPDDYSKAYSHAGSSNSSSGVTT